MATYDISRVAFDPAKHYKSVRMQQGRVLTDDDFNENERIGDEDERLERIDVIGPYGSPDDGFKIQDPTVFSAKDGSQVIDFKILQGTVYLGGLRLELESDETFLLQDDWLEMPYSKNLAPASGSPDRYDFVYLEAWQQPVCAVEDSELFEMALGGPDTTTRLKNMARVCILPDTKADNCTDGWNALMNKWRIDSPNFTMKDMERVPQIKLTVSFTNAGTSSDPCSPNVAGGYLGAENQAIRVQLLDKGFFTWGFDDASPIYRVTISANGVVNMLTLPKDQYHWPLQGQTVEILPWSALLPNWEKVAARDGFISTVTAPYDPDKHTFSIGGSVPAGFDNWKNRSDSNDILTHPVTTPPDPPPTAYYFLRVWNRGTDITSPGKIAYSAGKPVILGNTGIQVQIDGTDQVRGDHWVIAARPDTPNRVVPWKLLTGEPPVGYHRFYAPLGIIYWTDTGGKTLTPKVIHDCRKTFQPLTSQDCCCTFTVGDGIESFGDYNSIEDAIASLPPDGGKICVLRGVHKTNAVIDQCIQITIEGCGEQSIVIAKKRGSKSPLFLITSSKSITIENLTLFAIEGIAIKIGSSNQNDTPCQEISVLHNRIIALTSGIYINPYNSVLSSTDIHIANNQIGILDKKNAGHCIFSIADDVIIERNRLVVILVPGGGGNGGGGGGGGHVFNPCLDYDKLYKDRKVLLSSVHELVGVIAIATLTKMTGDYLFALGGIQVGSGSERVWIYQNEIFGGLSNGITLCSLPAPDEDSDAGYNGLVVYSILSNDALKILEDSLRPVVYDIVIEENIIVRMGLSGIGMEVFFNRKTIGLIFRINGIDINGNIIQRCALQWPEESDNTMNSEIALGGIVLSAVENAIIRNNRIEDNGTDYLHPICGIFILYGEKIQVNANHILNNGVRRSTDDETAVKPGERGGIVILMALQLKDTKNLYSATTPASDAVPAASIFDNIVDQPYGHALFLIAFGQVSVIENTLTSKGYVINNPLSVLAGAVFILDLGISKDLLLLFTWTAGSFFGMADLSFDLASYSANALLIDVLDNLPSGKVMFDNNQVCMDLRNHKSAAGLSTQYIGTLDDISYDSNQSECTGFLFPGIADLVIFNTLLTGITVRANNNRFTDGITFVFFSLLAYGLAATAIGNISTHCVFVIANQPVLALNTPLIPSSLCDDKQQRLVISLKAYGS